MAEPSDAERFLAGLTVGRTIEEQQALLAALLGTGSRRRPGPRRVRPTPEPELRSPSGRAGFRVRIALLDTEPPVWRRIELPADIPLPALHGAIQASMGWSDEHLHRFRTGLDRRTPHFLTQADVEEGESGLAEQGVRLDQLVSDAGDRLWYEYDFGDGWDHLLTVEELLDERPETVR